MRRTDGVRSPDRAPTPVRARPSLGRLLLTAVALLTAAPAPARAWDNIGHMTIAGIAWARLSPAARAAAIGLLRAAPPDAGLAQLRPNDGGPAARDRALFMRAATWADLVRDTRVPDRRRRFHRASWHYVDQFWRTDAAGRAVPVRLASPAREHLVERIGALQAMLRDPRQPTTDRALALAWLLHLVGDAHQPLHAASRVTDSLPRGDRGGNAFRVGSSNLHALWDDAMDRSPGRRAGRRGGRGPSGDEARLARADGWAEQLPPRYPPAAFGPGVADSTAAGWARAGLALAQRWVYPPTLTAGPPPPPAYLAQLRRVAEPQVTLAGYRLAALLERVLAPRP